MNARPVALCTASMASPRIRSASGGAVRLFTTTWMGRHGSYATGMPDPGRTIVNANQSEATATGAGLPNGLADYSRVGGGGSTTLPSYVTRSEPWSLPNSGDDPGEPGDRVAMLQPRSDATTVKPRMTGARRRHLPRAARRAARARSLLATICPWNSSRRRLAARCWGESRAARTRRTDSASCLTCSAAFLFALRPTAGTIDAGGQNWSRRRTSPPSDPA